MDALVRNAWLVPFFPLLGGLIAAVGGKWLKQQSHLPVVAGIGLAFLISMGLLSSVGSTEATPTPIGWLNFTGLTVPIQFQADGLTTMMLSMVTFVATLVAIYASGYMAGDPGYPRFFAVVGLFVFSMTGLVLSSNYLLTYAFWEGVGVCSYLLVGFWYAKPEAAAAAKKAFLVNRVGDVGFAIAIFWMWTLSPGGDLSYGAFLDEANIAALPHAALIGIPLLLFWAATAKSAQVPLYVWLPDAMEGPTPVSALIHAATMVTAGVYLIARSTPLLVQVPEVQIVVSVIGCITALLAAAIALTQTDLKRVMAYSTVSQLGYMFMALGAGVEGVAGFAIIAGMFHLFTHAFFKALLFLASGSVMHSMGGVIDMREFGGLRKRLPITHLTFAMGALALCGFPIWAGFYSKDEILIALKRAGEAANGSGGTGWGWAYHSIYWVAVLTAFMTAFYTGRAYFMTFWGPERLPDPSSSPHHGATEPDAAHHDSHGHDATGHGHADGHDSHFGHESPPSMTIPLMILAVCATLVGLAFGPTHWFEHHLELTHGLHAEGAEHAVEAPADLATPIVGTTVALLGLGLAFALYFKPSTVPGRIAAALGPLYRASLNKFYIDELYTAIIVWPTRLLGVTAEFLDKFLVDGIVQGISWIPRLVGKQLLGPIQNGLIQYYAAVTALSVGVLLLALLFLI
ncbi:NADH-quinone oxidoreductase subunit L [Tundrisphaera lichenicola]|uniref:NADH-quinone oxidoreductase subunit L n=1 Tax=Tundrisphaera lichenicola TaxID=2029860 RepID=UPI003EBAFF66